MKTPSFLTILVCILLLIVVYSICQMENTIQYKWELTLIMICILLCISILNILKINSIGGIKTKIRIGFSGLSDLITSAILIYFLLTEMNPGVLKDFVLYYIAFYILILYLVVDVFIVFKEEIPSDL